jgi:hypothetical protein
MRGRGLGCGLAVWYALRLTVALTDSHAVAPGLRFESVGNQVSLRATRNREAHLSLRGCALDLLMTMLGLFLFVALGVLGRADLASLGVDACATLSFAFHDFVGGFWWHYVSRCHNVCGAILVSGEPNIGTLVS